MEALHSAVAAAAEAATSASLAVQGGSVVAHPGLRVRPRSEAIAFLGLEEHSDVHQDAWHVLPTSFHLMRGNWRGDFKAEMCAPGEAIRIDPNGMPYLVDIEERQNLQLDFALLFALATFVGSAVFAARMASNQQKASRESEPVQAKAKAAPKAKEKAKAKAKPKAGR
eukprot:gb/GFBE01060968.1/.p1 GENE.gb/GFBE01060968.1/~~gb/GFBE01060968.1/.p1  ORF type:complete len:168 (+),score=35.10 gb/GFBE01060968.1/:1-504(+)